MYKMKMIFILSLFLFCFFSVSFKTSSESTNNLQILCSTMANPDLIVNGTSNIISSSQTYNNIIVINQGNLTIISPALVIASNVQVLNGSFFSFNYLEVLNSFTISGSSVNGLITSSLAGFSLTIENNSLVTMNYTYSYPIVPTVSISDSFVYLGGFEGNLGSWVISNSTVNGLLTSSISGFNLTIENNSFVNMNYTYSYPLVHDLSIISSTVYLGGFEPYSGNWVISNSTLKGLLVGSTYSFNIMISSNSFVNMGSTYSYPLVHDLSITDSTVYFGGIEVYKGNWTISNSTLKGLITGSYYTFNLTIINNSNFNMNYIYPSPMINTLNISDSSAYLGGFSINNKLFALNSTVTGIFTLTSINFFSVKDSEITLNGYATIINGFISNSIATFNKMTVTNMQMYNSNISFFDSSINHGLLDIYNSHVTGTFASSLFLYNNFSLNTVNSTINFTDLSIFNSYLEPFTIAGTSNITDSFFTFTGFNINDTLDITNSTGYFYATNFLLTNLKFTNDTITFSNSNLLSNSNFDFNNDNIMFNSTLGYINLLTTNNTTITFKNSEFLLGKTFQVQYQELNNNPFLIISIKYLGSINNVPLQLEIQDLTNYSGPIFINLVNYNESYFFVQIGGSFGDTYSIRLRINNTYVGQTLSVSIPEITTTTAKHPHASPGITAPILLIALVSLTIYKRILRSKRL